MDLRSQKYKKIFLNDYKSEFMQRALKPNHSIKLRTSFANDKTLDETGSFLNFFFTQWRYCALKTVCWMYENVLLIID